MVAAAVTLLAPASRDASQPRPAAASGEHPPTLGQGFTVELLTLRT